MAADLLHGVKVNAGAPGTGDKAAMEEARQQGGD